ncbi:hypothetical protein PCANC_02617 [Puccinia coronata f. sp. avenae]|uniref:Uncharacterized protein n=1 Tax=Puccinia coronata f. sp. avenae TaxID=200324 RepID=A0A2N5W5H5_9BASI|nr:hypothetical protein PCANC_02617 [Puccinia coronata f. sp. avenae]
MLFQHITVQNGTPSSSTNSSPSSRKSITAKQLKDARKNNANHELKKVDLEGVGSKLLNSCYDLTASKAGSDGRIRWPGFLATEFELVDNLLGGTAPEFKSDGRIRY